MAKFKLNTEQIRDMMNAIASGESKYSQAKRFGITKKTVYNLIEKIKNQPKEYVGINWEALREEFK